MYRNPPNLYDNLPHRITNSIRKHNGFITCRGGFSPDAALLRSQINKIAPLTYRALAGSAIAVVRQPLTSLTRFQERPQDVVLQSAAMTLQVHLALADPAPNPARSVHLHPSIQQMPIGIDLTWRDSFCMGRFAPLSRYEVYLPLFESFDFSNPTNISKRVFLSVIFDFLSNLLQYLTRDSLSFTFYINGQQLNLTFANLPLIDHSYSATFPFTFHCPTILRTPPEP